LVLDGVLAAETESERRHRAGDRRYHCRNVECDLSLERQGHHDGAWSIFVRMAEHQSPRLTSAADEPQDGQFDGLPVAQFQPVAAARPVRIGQSLGHQPLEAD
jgi:hypothetical protein